MDAGRTALVAGALDQAALHFGLALRVAPALAPAVLEATEGARSAGLSMVRGDAYRLAGHETSAKQAYAMAARGGPPERRSRARKKAEPVATSQVAEATTGLDDEAATPRVKHGPAAPTLELDPADRPVAAGAGSDTVEPAAAPVAGAVATDTAEVVAPTDTPAVDPPAGTDDTPP